MCHRLVPNSKYHLAQGSGHSVYWEKPYEFNEVVLRYLLQIDGLPSGAAK
jgi:pimeloyl-ACP methyl ester carboxylesterase